MSIFLIIIAGIPILSLLWWWWADRNLKRHGFKRIRVAMALAMVLLVTGFAMIIGERREIFPFQTPAILNSLVLLWGILFLPLLALPMMGAWSVSCLIRKAVSRDPSATTQSGDRWTRRKCLGMLATIFPVVATFAAAGYGIPMVKKFRIRNLTVNIEDLPAGLDGLKIAHVTDTHVGKLTNGSVLDEIVNATNRLDADLILFTGDLINSSIEDLPTAVEMLLRMKSKSGLFMIEGNHDLFDDADGFVRGVRDAGLSLLRNESARVMIRGEAVELLGTVWSHGADGISADVDVVAGLRSPTAFPILLAHHPHAFDRAVHHKFPLTLAGHTHGGQLMLTPDIGGGPAIFRYWSGLYEKSKMALVVGNGTGNWFPVRVNAPAEIIELTLRRASPSNS